MARGKKNTKKKPVAEVKLATRGGGEPAALSQPKTKTASPAPSQPSAKPAFPAANADPVELEPELKHTKKRKKKKKRCRKKKLFMLAVALLGPVLVSLIAAVATRGDVIQQINGGALMILNDFRQRIAAEWVPREMSMLVDSSLAQIESALLDFNQTLDTQRPGVLLASSENGEQPLTPKHHVLMIPGVVSGALEVWKAKACARSMFRERVWGRTSMIQLMVGNPMCWIEHMSLTEEGADPEGIKVRPALGLDAADWLFPGYWVWAMLIQNLADLGYDPSTMQTGGYDWRLPLLLTEQRDRTFSTWKNQIELKRRLTGEKTVLVSHSYGALVAFYFVQWCENEGGEGWVNAHLASWANIGGPLLGAHKAIGTYMSAEMRDTAQMHPLVSLALDRFVPQSVRLSLVRSWSSGLAMFPKGGDQIWGSAEAGAPDDNDDHDGNGNDNGNDSKNKKKKHSVGGVLTLHDKQANTTRVLDADEALELLASVSSPAFANIIHNLYSWGVDPQAAQHPSRWKNQPRKWTNALETPLPNAPDFEVYCLYGVGKSTERGFHYTDDFVPPAPLPNGKLGPSIPYRLHNGISNPEVDLIAGVQQGDGDGTVPLLSMGYMCSDGWTKYPGLNPARSRTIVREYLHEPSSPMISPRGIPTTADHVDIMGNHDLITDVLKIAAGERLNNNIVSKLKDYSAKIKLRSTQ